MSCDVVMGREALPSDGERLEWPGRGLPFIHRPLVDQRVPAPRRRREPRFTGPAARCSAYRLNPAFNHSRDSNNPTQCSAGSAVRSFTAPLSSPRNSGAPLAGSSRSQRWWPQHQSRHPRAPWKSARHRDQTCRPRRHRVRRHPAKLPPDHRGTDKTRVRAMIKNARRGIAPSGLPACTSLSTFVAHLNTKLNPVPESGAELLQFLRLNVKNKYITNSLQNVREAVQPWRRRLRLGWATR